MNFSNINHELLYKPNKKHQTTGQFSEMSSFMMKSNPRFNFPHTQLFQHNTRILANGVLEFKHSILIENNNNKLMEKLIKKQEDLTETIHYLENNSTDPLNNSKKLKLPKEVTREEIILEKNIAYEVKTLKNIAEPIIKKPSEPAADDKMAKEFAKDKFDLEEINNREANNEKPQQNEVKQPISKNLPENIEFQKSILNQSLVEKLVSEKLSAEKFVKDNQHEEIQEKKTKKGYVQTLEATDEEKKKVKRNKGNKQKTEFNLIEQKDNENKENSIINSLKVNHIIVILGIIVLITLTITALS